MSTHETAAPASDRRAEANRRNALKSTGPKTDEGKARSCLNGLTHGLRAQMIVLPGEDPEAYEAERRALFEEFLPATPTERRLLDTMAAAQWALDRCRRQEVAVLSRRVATASAEFEARREREFERLAASLRGSTTSAPLRRLRATARGRDWLIGCWRALGAALPNEGGWSTRESDLILNLLGHHPIDVFEGKPLAQEVLMWALAVRCRRSTAPRLDIANELCRFRDSGLSEAAFQGHVDRLCAIRPPYPAAVARLEALIAAQIALLESAPAVDDAPDPALDEAREQALALALFDGSPEGALRLRYMTAQQNTYSRALRDLLALRKQRRLEREEEEEATPAPPAATVPSEPIPLPEPPPPAPEPALPTEAKSPASALPNEAISAPLQAPRPDCVPKTYPPTHKDTRPGEQDRPWDS